MIKYTSSIHANSVILGTFLSTYLISSLTFYCSVKMYAVLDKRHGQLISGLYNGLYDPWVITSC